MYSDQKFYARHLMNVGYAISLSTTTANSTVGADASDVIATLPKFIRRTKLLAVRLRVTVIPDSGSTNLKLHFMNGTNTAAVVTLTTATADQWLDGVVTAANSTFAADVQPTVNLTGTATASADANGSYDVWFETQELYA